MYFQFPSDISQRLEACVLSGAYGSEVEVLREALDALDQRELEKSKRWHAGNRRAMEQSRQGLSQPLKDEEVIARLRRRLSQEGITD